MIVTKYVIITPKDISTVGGVYKMTLPTAAIGFLALMVCEDYHTTSAYEAGKDNRQLWVLKGDDTAINTWIEANSDMVVEKTFAEVDAIGKELQPGRNYTAHRVITEDGIIVEESDVVKNIAIFDLQTRLTNLGI